MQRATALGSSDADDSVATSAESAPWSPSFAVAVAHVNADIESEVESWRRANADNSGRAAIWLYIARRALWEAGVATTDRVMVAFDCRRYLRRGRTSNGNFAAGLEVPLAVNATLPEVNTRLKEITVSAVPLLGMGVVSARTLLRAGRKPSTTPDSCQVGVPAALMYTDVGHITSLDDAPWRQGGQQSYTGLLDPYSPNSITVLNSRIGIARNLSISFHDNVFDRRAIGEAAAYMSADPIRILEGK